MAPPHSTERCTERTRRFALTLLETLQSHARDDGQLVDPVTREPIPHTQYAATTFATAALRASALTGEPHHRSFAERTLQNFLDRSEEECGHQEFNTFALLELLEDVKQGWYASPVPKRRLRTALRFKSTPYSSDGNNWLLLQCLCRVKRAELIGSISDRLYARRILALARNWERDDGLIADAPRRPITPSETPLTYHAKLTMLYARLAERLDADRLYHVALRGLSQLDQLSLPTGECLFYGRSENTLFGYANVLDAITHVHSATPESPPWVDSMYRRTASYLTDSFDPTIGHSQPDAYADSVEPLDSYLHDGVYAAYASMILLGLPEIGPSDPEPANGESEHRSTHICSESGLTTVSTGRSSIGTTLTGQPHLRQGTLDPRYAGLIPHAYTYESETVYPGVPQTISEQGQYPFLPSIKTNRGRFSPMTWRTRARTTDTGLSAVGTGYHYPAPEPTKSNATTEEADSPSAILQFLDRHPELKRLLRRIDANTVYNRSQFKELVERYVKTPRTTDIDARRGFHVRGDADVLVLQTVLATPGRSTIRPSSYVVKPAFRDAVSRCCSEETASHEAAVETHKGTAQWVTYDSVSVTDLYWSSLVFDPSSRVLQHEASFDSNADLLTTRLELTDEILELRDQLPSRTTMYEPEVPVDGHLVRRFLDAYLHQE